MSPITKQQVCVAALSHPQVIAAYINQLEASSTTFQTLRQTVNREVKYLREDDFQNLADVEERLRTSNFFLESITADAAVGMVIRPDVLTGDGDRGTVDQRPQKLAMDLEKSLHLETARIQYTIPSLKTMFAFKDCRISIGFKYRIEGLRIEAHAIRGPQATLARQRKWSKEQWSARPDKSTLCDATMNAGERSSGKSAAPKYSIDTLKRLKDGIVVPISIKLLAKIDGLYLVSGGPRTPSSVRIFTQNHVTARRLLPYPHLPCSSTNEGGTSIAQVTSGLSEPQYLVSN
jgi:hypothetical protein